MTIERKLKNGREEYEFTFIDKVWVFTRYEKFEAPQGKRKQIRTAKWDNYSSRDSNISQPDLPQNVRNEVYDNAIKAIKIQTASDFFKK